MNISLNDKGSLDRVGNQNGQNNGHQGWYSGLKKERANEGLVLDVTGQRLTWKARGEDTGYIFSIYEMTLLPENALKQLRLHPMRFTVFATAPVSLLDSSAFLLNSTRRFLTNTRFRPETMILHRFFLRARS